MDKISALEAYKVSIVLEDVSNPQCLIFVVVCEEVDFPGLAQAEYGRGND